MATRLPAGLFWRSCQIISPLAQAPAKFGVTELAVGVPFPAQAFDAVFAALPLRARKLIYTASLHDFADIYDMGVEDSLTANPEEDALNWLEKVTSFPSVTFAHTKQQWRRKVMGGVSDMNQPKAIADILASEQVQQTLRAALNARKYSILNARSSPERYRTALITIGALVVFYFGNSHHALPLLGRFLRNGSRRPTH